MKILVTGAAGFIGSKLMFSLAGRGDEVVGIDNLNDYYDVRLKHGRIAEFCTGERKRFIEAVGEAGRVAHMAHRGKM